MPNPSLTSLATNMILVGFAAFAVAAFFTPSGSTTQLLVAGVLVAVALPIVYYLTYRGRSESAPEG